MFNSKAKRIGFVLILALVLVQFIGAAPVLALTAITSIDSTLGNTAVVGEEKAFTVSTTAYEAGETVRVKVYLTDPSQKDDLELQYFETTDSLYHPLTFDDTGVTWFGPATGFPLADATSDFKVTFNAAGTYEYTMEIIASSDNSVLASKIESVTVSPLITGVTDGSSYNTDVIPVFTEGTGTLNGIAFTSGTPITAEGSYILAVTEGVDNTTTVNFTIDKTAPIVTGVTDGTSYNVDVTPQFNEGNATLNGDSFTSGTPVTNEDNYVLIVTDAAGNKTTVNFVIDKTGPTVTGVTDGTSYNTDVIPVFTEGTATLNSAVFTSGTPVTAEGDYVLTVTDSVGNTTTVNFTIDKSRPVVNHSDPVDNAENIVIDTAITINFGEDILDSDNYSTINIKAGENAIEYDAHIDGNNLILTPDSNLSYFTIYTVTIPAGAVRDVVGNDLANDYTFSFKTEPILVTKVKLNKESTTIKVGETETLVATIEPENATNQNVTWSSSDETVATVDPNGLVTAVQPGDATITVTTEDGPFTAACDVIVPVKLVINGNDKVEINLRNKLDFQLRDDLGNPVNAPEGGASVTITVKDSDEDLFWNNRLFDSAIGGNEIYRDEYWKSIDGYWEYVYDITIPEGEDAVTVYLRSGSVGDFSVEANVQFNGRDYTGSKLMTITPAKQTYLEFDESTEYINAGERGQIVVSVRDQYGNLVNQESNLYLDLSASSPTAKFYLSDDPADSTVFSSVYISKGESSVAFYVYDTRSDGLEIAAASGNLETAYWWMWVNPLEPVDIQLEMDYAYADDYNELWIFTVDKFGNKTYSETPLTVDLSSSGNGKFYVPWEGQVSQVTIDDWEAWVLYYNDTTGPDTISASTTEFETSITVQVINGTNYPDRMLYSGWNTLSVPIALEDQTLNSILGDSAGNVEAIFAFKNGGFQKITNLNTELQLLDAVFVKVRDGKQVPVTFWDKITDVQTAPPSRDLKAGWNFVGPAVWTPDIEWFSTSMSAADNFASVSGKYSQVISPNYNQRPWIYIAGNDSWVWVDAGYGYWVFMKEDGTLAGFSYTPIYDGYYEDYEEA